jgi:hypothetical protein
MDLMSTIQAFLKGFKEITRDHAGKRDNIGEVESDSTWTDYINCMLSSQFQKLINYVEINQ